MVTRLSTKEMLEHEELEYRQAAHHAHEETTRRPIQLPTGNAEGEEC